jgi:hypothetical protein
VSSSKNENEPPNVYASLRQLLPGFFVTVFELAMISLRSLVDGDSTC